VGAKPDQSIVVYEFDSDKSLERLARELIFTIDEKTETVWNTEEHSPEDSVPPHEDLNEEEKKEVPDNTELQNPEDGENGEENKEEAEPADFPALEMDNVQDFLSDLTNEAMINSLKSQLKSDLESEVVKDEYKLSLVKRIADELCVPYTARSGYISIYKKILEQI
jgi:hypothetical protein